MVKQKKQHIKHGAKKNQESEAPKASQLVKQAKQVKNPIQTFPDLKKTIGEKEFEISYARSCKLSHAEINWVVELTERNMKEMYRNSSWGWDGEDKQQELQSVAACYLLVKSNSEPLAFCHFRFVTDFGFPVLYIYELQCEASVQRMGIGTWLMDLLGEVAAKHRMQKIVLTVFKHNPSAWNFYTKKLGFTIDSSSPSKFGDSESYEILSKAVSPQ